MKIEHASHGTARKVIPPTRAEFEEAARRGHKTISGELLAEIRTAAKATRQATRAGAFSGSPVATDAAKIKVLAAQVAALQQENTKLKVRVMQGK